MVAPASKSGLRRLKQAKKAKKKKPIVKPKRTMLYRGDTPKDPVAPRGVHQHQRTAPFTSSSRKKAKKPKTPKGFPKRPKAKYKIKY